MIIGVVHEQSEFAKAEAVNPAEDSAEDQQEIPVMQKIAILMVSLGGCVRRGDEAPYGL